MYTLLVQFLNLKVDMSVQNVQNMPLGYESVCKRPWRWVWMLIFLHVAACVADLSIIIDFTILITSVHLFPWSSNELVSANTVRVITPDTLWLLFVRFLQYFSTMNFSHLLATIGDWKTSNQFWFFKWPCKYHFHIECILFWSWSMSPTLHRVWSPALICQAIGDYNALLHPFPMTNIQHYCLKITTASDETEPPVFMITKFYFVS